MVGTSEKVAVTATDLAFTATDLEATYRSVGPRLWRAVLAYSGDPTIADDAVAEAFAQVIRRGSAVRSPGHWVWRAAFRIAAGQLKERRRTAPLFDDAVTVDDSQVR